MADGGEPGAGEYFHTRQEGAFKPLSRDGEDPDTWLSKNRHEIPAPPVEVERRDLVIVLDASPSSNPDHRPRSGAGVEHTVSQHALEKCGISQPEIEYPTLSAEDAKQLTTKDQTKHDRTKEQNRARRGRSRIVRNGNAPQVDPARFPEAAWAVDLVNLVTLKRYSPPELEQGRPYGVTTWLKDLPAEKRGIAAWIFRHVVRHGGGPRPATKFSPRTIVAALAAGFFPANMEIDGDAPTPLIEGKKPQPHRLAGARIAFGETITKRWTERVRPQASCKATTPTPPGAMTDGDHWRRNVPRSLVDRQRELLAVNLHMEMCPVTDGPCSTCALRK
jgi:hypothetical protein